MVLWEQIITNWDIWSTLITTAYDEMIGQTEIGAALAPFSEILGGLVTQLAYLIFYPLLWVLNIIEQMVLVVMEPIVGLFNAIFSAGSAIYSVINIFSGTFPTPWIVGLTAILSIVIGLRIYALIPVFGRK